MSRQVLQLFLGRHGNASLGTGHYHRLRHVGHGEFDLQLGGSGKGCADPRNNLVLYLFPFQDPHLLQHCAVN